MMAFLIAEITKFQQWYNSIQHPGIKFQTSNPETVKKQILELALLNNLNIVSLQSEDIKALKMCSGL